MNLTFYSTKDYENEPRLRAPAQNELYFISRVFSTLRRAGNYLKASLTQNLNLQHYPLLIGNSCLYLFYVRIWLLPTIIGLQATPNKIFDP
ncbi:hypothetical protein ES703_125306 [subsurface metagenome]